MGAVGVKSNNSKHTLKIKLNERYIKFIKYIECENIHLGQKKL